MCIGVGLVRFHSQHWLGCTGFDVTLDSVLVNMDDGLHDGLSLAGLLVCFDGFAHGSNSVTLEPVPVAPVTIVEQVPAIMLVATGLVIVYVVLLDGVCVCHGVCSFGVLACTSACHGSIVAGSETLSSFLSLYLSIDSLGLIVFVIV